MICTNKGLCHRQVELSAMCHIDAWSVAGDGDTDAEGDN